ncbi:uncharacterized protein FIBRA_05258 [Fibroporia radiculosa]|uniref:Conserved oligomeric Golgi complex subunit 1 n=1 Tax=Fibroporia radiculosa TaxID=599839 RepID=J4HX78_9APHY|nr:uncharacterized protein FIBRA_05258 [Fibroporia radiculosa]CCM03137.1 predicted protein [Fibroporia radiculosa]
MAARPSVMTSRSSAANLQLDPANIESRPWALPRSSSLAATVGQTLPDDFNPDDLFSKHTISEVKVVQQRFRSNAEAKQEELRIMVGERYRDLLQASASIISMAETSKHAMKAFNEMHAVVSSVEMARAPKRTSIAEEDKHLQALQSLSAHLKLLLDAPEHLWRFMEQQQYYHAAWLFLTTRVVHRTLLQEENGDQSWRVCGINVLEQVPLVQRQWDAVSQFRPQIAHKATLSLRELTTSPGEVCATLLTLHLLESRPLAETASIFLAQRSKTLSSALLQSGEHLPNGPTLGSSESDSKLSSRSRKLVVREIKQKIRNVMDIISRTVGLARVIFEHRNGSNEPSMMETALEFIQSDSAHSRSLPSELRLSIQSLLSSLPSSTHHLLSANIRSYKPYVDVKSSSSAISQSEFHDRVSTWFTKSVDTARVAITHWFSILLTVQEVWDVRSSSWNWILTLDGLDTSEKRHIKSLFDELTQRQVKAVWKSTLDLVEASFEERLDSALGVLMGDPQADVSDPQPVEYLFRAPPISAPSSSPSKMNPSPAVISFQRYRSSLQRQLDGRTPLLDDFLSMGEQYALELEKDMQVIRDVDSDSQYAQFFFATFTIGLTTVLVSMMSAQLLESYRPGAEALCFKLVDLLEKRANASDNAEISKLALIFLSRIAGEYSSSTFPRVIGCSDAAIEVFQERMHNLHAKALEQWRQCIVQQSVEKHWLDSSSRPATSRAKSGNILDNCRVGSLTLTAATDTFTSARLSSSMTAVLLSLSTSMYELGAFADPSYSQHAVGMLRSLIVSLLDNYDLDEGLKEQADVQIYHDFRFMQKLVELWGNMRSEATDRLDSHLRSIGGKLLTQGIPVSLLDIDREISEQLSRMQNLITPLLPQPVSNSASLTSKGAVNTGASSSLLRYGVPSVEQGSLPALDLVKPSARFGLLLVGTTTVR